jgi:hypothetical protein
MTTLVIIASRPGMNINIFKSLLMIIFMAVLFTGLQVK